MDRIKIYSLEDANTGEIRYIGYTTKSLDERLTAHFRNVREAFDSKTRKINKRLSWLKSIDCNATITLLDEGTKDDIIWMEQMYISLFKSWGFRLTNGTLGGDGGNTFAKLSDKEKRSCRKKLSKASKGRINGPLSDSHKESLRKNHAIVNGKIPSPSFNRPVSKEAKEKMRIAARNRNINADFSKIFTKRIYLGIEQYDKLDNLINTFNTLEEASLYISLTTIASKNSIKANINRNIAGKQSFAYNFIWKLI